MVNSEEQLPITGLRVHANPQHSLNEGNTALRGSTKVHRAVKLSATF